MFQKSKRIEGFLDKLASRAGIVSIVGALLGLCTGAGYYIQSVVDQLEENHAIFRDTQVRNGYVGMSDVQRLTLVVQGAIVEGRMTEELKVEFRDATDILFVRADNFERQIAKREGLETGIQSVAAIRQVVAIADEALAQDFPDLVTLTRDLLDASEDARAYMVRFLDDTRRQADEVLETQSIAVRNQQVFVLVSMAGLTLFGSVALLFLQREVLGRRARETAERRVEFLAFFDSLTELPNRVQFQERLQAMLDDGHPLALLYVDLDDFKTINDTYGHAAGDSILRHVSGILGAVATENGGFAARLAGDEFATVIPTDDLHRLTAVCQQIVTDAPQPVMVDGEALQVTLSVGLSTTTQVSLQMEPSVDVLSRVTDFALYASKTAGRNRFTIYDRQLEERFLERRAMLEELPGAIEKGHLKVHFQPKVLLPQGSVFGFEALVRWRRNGKLVPPGEFILLAEESGLVIDIDHCVLDRSTKIIADWNRQHGTQFSVSVNLSALHFTSERIADFVQMVLWRSDLAPECLTLEITETMEVRDWKQAQATIAKLHHMGCKIAIDDFGTGYSSLAYLRTTTADELKIDQSLVMEVEKSEKARLLLSSVFDIARNLRLDVTVEGIETRGQAEIIHRLGAQQAQGFLFGRPEEPDTALALATWPDGDLPLQAIGS